MKRFARAATEGKAVRRGRWAVPYLPTAEFAGSIADRVDFLVGQFVAVVRVRNRMLVRDVLQRI